MANSPWAVIRNAQTPIQADTPSVWAPIPEQPMEQSDIRSRNVVNHFGEGPGKPIPLALQSRLDGPSPMDQDISNTQEQLQKIRYAQTHPWGTPENHPGKLGKLAHVFSEVGNIAGNIVAPNVMANIPQTQLGMKANEERLTGRLNEEEKNKALENEQQATTGHLNAETQEVAPNAQSQRELQGAQESNLESETKMREHPLPEYSSLPFLTPEGQATEMEKHSGAVTPVGPEGLRYGRVQDKFQHVNGTVNGVPTAAFADPLNHAYVDQNGNPIPDFKPMPQVGMQGPVVISPDTGQVRRATPGTTLPEGFRTITQQGALNGPTTQQRNVGAQAALVHEQAPAVIADIQANAAQMGPLSGRWNEFMQGRIGAPNPQMAGLRADLLMYSSAVALMHARGRLPENLREEFDHSINRPDQTPENLIATIQKIDQWTAANMNAMGGQQGAPPAPAAGPKVLKFNAQTGRLE